MAQQEFEITIGPGGSVELHVKGYKGRRCLDALKMFEQIVGSVSSQKATGEMYEPEEQVRHQLDQRH